ncbi:MAG: DUF3293 domain-containing protein [Polyangiaceae bacterium]|nr:DUF3293 domain-containing protein [Polyangiaceae bacterium]
MDQNLLRSYFSTIYELPSSDGLIRTSIDGETINDKSTLPKILNSNFAILTAYNPRSMLLPRRVNEQRHLVMRDLLILGCYRVEACVGFDDDPDASWREPSWLVHGIERQEALDFGRTFRQNCILHSQDAQPELVITDPTCDELGKTYPGNWRVRH